MRRIAWPLGAVLFALFAVLIRCSKARLTMPTPSLFLREPDPYAHLAPELKGTEVPLFYVTGRGPERDADGDLRQPPC